MEKELIIKCDCESHAIQFHYDDLDPYWKYVEISIWERATKSRPLSIKERIRWCWRILTTGQPWTDSVMISHDNLKPIIDYLNDIHSCNKSTNQ